VCRVITEVVSDLSVSRPFQLVASTHGRCTVVISTYVTLSLERAHMVVQYLFFILFI